MYECVACKAADLAGDKAVVRGVVCGLIAVSVIQQEPNLSFAEALEYLPLNITFCADHSAQLKELQEETAKLLDLIADAMPG